MKKYICISLVLVMSSVVIIGKNVGELLIAMPESEIPYVEENFFGKLVDMKRIDPDSPACLGPILNEKICLNTLNDSILNLTFSDIEYEIGRLQSADGIDSVFCVLRTQNTPEPETRICIVDSTWNVLQEVSFDDITFFINDTVSEEKRMEIVNAIEYPAVEAHFASVPGEIILKYNIHPLISEDKEIVLHSILQKKVKWDGRSYK